MQACPSYPGREHRGICLWNFHIASGRAYTGISFPIVRHEWIRMLSFNTGNPSQSPRVWKCKEHSANCLFTEAHWSKKVGLKIHISLFHCAVWNTTPEKSSVLALSHFTKCQPDQPHHRSLAMLAFCLWGGKNVVLIYSFHSHERLGRWSMGAGTWEWTSKP